MQGAFGTMAAVSPAISSLIVSSALCFVNIFGNSVKEVRKRGKRERKGEKGYLSFTAQPRV